MYKYRMIISKCEHILHGKIIVLTAQVYNRNMFLLEKIKYLYSGIFLSTTAHNNPVHIARMHKFVKSVVSRLCQDLKNNTYPEHLSFLVTIVTVSLLMVCYSLVCILFIFDFTRKNSRNIFEPLKRYVLPLTVPVSFSS